MSSGVGLLILLLAYLLPSLIASRRDHPQLGPIVIINVAFGWTLLGWIAALAWSCSAVEK